MKAKFIFLIIFFIQAIIINSCSKEESNLPENTTLKATWSSCDQWASWSNGGYTLYNNIWGSGAGTQCIWANSYSNWGVWANHPNTSGIKSYPNVSKDINKKLSSLSTLKSSFNVTVPSSGSYNTAYDIWGNNYAVEVMLWVNKLGSVGPIASNYNCNGACPEFTNVNVGGHTWNVYKGYNGSTLVISFLRTSNTNSGTVDIKAILNWAKNKGWFNDITIQKVQCGWEITSSSGGLDFRFNSYSVTFN